MGPSRPALDEDVILFLVGLRSTQPALRCGDKLRRYRTHALFCSSGAVSSLMVTPVTYEHLPTGRTASWHWHIDQDVNLVEAFRIG